MCVGLAPGVDAIVAPNIGAPRQTLSALP